ncbi:MAG: hypothetical protein ACTSRI_10345 [Promethearchaeota archaeon]
MPQDQEELWIFSKEGRPIVDFSKDATIDESLLGGFISTIKSFSQELSGKELKSFSLMNHKFILMPYFQDDFIIVCRRNSNVKDKKIFKICKVIGKIFEDMYDKNELKKWDGDHSFFNKFKNRLDLYFKMGNL